MVEAVHVPRSVLRVRKTLTNLVTERLRDDIIHNRFRPGELLSTGRIAAAMGISSMPVRTAFACLEAEGLLSIAPQRGVRVSTLSIAELEEVYAIRSRLEGLAVFLACRHLTNGDLRRLRALLSAMVRHAKANDARRWLAANEQWHHLLFKASQAKLLVRLLTDLWRRAMWHRAVAPMLAGHMERRHPEHLAILKALEKRDAEEAERRCRAHILKSVQEVIKHVKSAQGLAAEPPRTFSQPARGKGRPIGIGSASEVRDPVVKSRLSGASEARP